MRNPPAPGSAKGASGPFIISDQLNGNHATAATSPFDTATECPAAPTDRDRQLLAYLLSPNGQYLNRAEQVQDRLLGHIVDARRELQGTWEPDHDINRAIGAVAELALARAEEAAYQDNLRAVRAVKVAEAVETRRIKDEADQLYARERSGVPELGPPVSLAELLARPGIVVRHRIGELLPAGGRVILAAQAKAGKTTLVGNLIRCLTSGAPFLGRFPVIPVRGGVTLIDTEMPEGTIKHWLADQGICRPERVTVESLRGKVSAFDILDPPGRQRWAARLKSVGTEVLIFDCLRPLLDSFGLDENNDVGLVVVALDELVARAEISELIVVHHMGHTGERSRGSSRLRDWPDGEWRLLRKDQEKGQEDPTASRFFAAYGRDVAVGESRLEFDQTTRHLTIVGGSRKAAAVEELMPRLLAELVEHPDLSAKGVEDALTVPYVITRALVRATLQEGLRSELVVKRDGNGNAKLHRVNPSADLSKFPDLRERLAGESNSQDRF